MIMYNTYGNFLLKIRSVDWCRQIMNKSSYYIQHNISTAMNYVITLLYFKEKQKIKFELWFLNLEINGKYFAVITKIGDSKSYTFSLKI